MQHLASDVSFGTDYEGIIQASKDMTTTFLAAANKQKSVKSVVLTSSRIASYNPQYGTDIHATKEDWTDYFVDLARDAALDDPSKPILICTFPSRLMRLTSNTMLMGRRREQGRRGAGRVGVHREKQGTPFVMVRPVYTTDM